MDVNYHFYMYITICRQDIDTKSGEGTYLQVLELFLSILNNSTFLISIFISRFGFPWFYFADDVVSNLYYHSIVIKLLLLLNATLRQCLPKNLIIEQSKLYLYFVVYALYRDFHHGTVECRLSYVLLKNSIKAKTS